MELKQLQQQIRAFVLSNFYVADEASVTNRSSLLEQGVIDSTGVLEVISFIESTCGITVEDDEMLPENLGSIECIARFVSRKQAAAASVPVLAPA